MAAISLRNLVHCALAVAVSLAGIAGLYLSLGAQFVGFAQVLVYLGAVAILIVFAILLTRSSEVAPERLLSKGWALAIGLGAAVFAVLAGVIVDSTGTRAVAGTPPTAHVRDLGNELMTRYALPFEALGVLLTAALIGAVIIALNEKKE